MLVRFLILSSFGFSLASAVGADLPRVITDLQTEVILTELPSRIDSFSRHFLKTPFGDITYETENPVGDISAKVEALLTQDEFKYDFDRFDCVTYVETVLALALSYPPHLPSPRKPMPEFEYYLKKLRYKDGKSQFLKRNHFMNTDWMENNAWVVQDITHQFKLNKHHATTPINKLSWLYNKKLIQAYTRLLQSKGQSFTDQDLAAKLAKLGETEWGTVQSELTYLELDQVVDKYDEFVAQAPDFTIIQIVRPNWDVSKAIGTQLDISHLGFGFKQHNDIIFRHSTVVANEGTVELSLKAYLQRMQDSSTIKGINVYTLGAYNKHYVKKGPN